MTDTELLDIEPPKPPASAAIVQRAVVLGAIVLLVGLGTFLVVNVGNESDPDADPDTTDRDFEDATEDATEDFAPIVVQPAGRFDGLESIGLPITASPDIGLVDAQVVAVTGSGFTAGITVGIVQCWGVVGGGSVDDCDLSNVGLATVDVFGDWTGELVVRRFIGVTSGERDCAEGGLIEGCAIAAGNVSNYDESGVVRTFFDPEIDGLRAPLVEVSYIDDLTDGEEMTVTGQNFAPGEILQTTQCVVGGLNGATNCFDFNPAGQIEVDGNGEFVVIIVASRLVNGIDGTIDCFSDPYGCRLLITGVRVPNPVRLNYNGAIRPPDDLEFTVTPSDGLFDGDVVRVDLFDLRTSGVVLISQCADQGPLGESCGAPVEAEIIDGNLTADVGVSRFLTNIEGDEVDCAEDGRTCYLRLTGDQQLEIRIPVRFASDDVAE